MTLYRNFITLTLTLLLTLLFTACNSKIQQDETNAQNPTTETTGDSGDDENTTNGQADDNTTTSPTVTPTSLKFTIDKTSLNKDENTTVKVMARYSDGTSKEVTESVEWIVVPNDTVKVTHATLKALQDKVTTIKAKLKGVTSDAVSLNITWIVNGHVLPPEPDKTLNDSTLLGIDANNNDVRDDVERWIYEEYKDKHPIHVDIAMQAGRAYKLVLEAPKRAKEIYPEVEKSIYCEGYYKYEAEFFNEKNLIEKNIDNRHFRHKIYFNTKERMNTYRQYDTLLSGDSYTLPNGKEMKAMCDFNTSKY